MIYAVLFFIMAAITSMGLPDRKSSPLEYAQHPRKRLASLFAFLGLILAVLGNR